MDNAQIINHLCGMHYITESGEILNLQAVLFYLREMGFTFHHGANRKGYITRKASGFIKEYSGRFGTGFTIEKPSFDGTMFHPVNYYIEIPANAVNK